MPTHGRLVLVDGSWLVFRAFFALPASLVTSGGLQTNAVLGFANMFRKLFSGRHPSAGAVIFDAPGPTTRHEQLPSYKADRGPMPPALAAQLPYIRRLVEAQGFPVVTVPGVEGDDLIGTLCQQAVDAGHEVWIVAGDKDFAQLIGPSVRMFDPMRDVVFDAELVYKKWGVKPDQIVDLLALMGDAADNIPGVAGIGQKGATDLLNAHGSLEGIYHHLDALPARQRTALTTHRDSAWLSRELATIQCKLALPVTVAELGVGAPDHPALQALYRELEFSSLLEGPATVSTTEIQSGPFVPGPGPVAVVPVLGERRGGRRELLAVLACERPGEVYRVPAEALSWLAREDVVKVAHESKELRKALAGQGIPLRACEDTMLASFLIEPTRNIPHRLDQICRDYLQEPLAAEAPAEQRVGVIRRLWPVLEARLGELSVHYGQIELPLAAVLAEMELAGVQVDREALAGLGAAFGVRRDRLEAEVHALAGHSFNLGSTNQLGVVLFEELKLPVIKKTKTGWSTDAEVLEALVHKHPIAQLLLDHRMLSKLINTYTEVLQKAVDAESGRIHATFQQTVGVSGRLISTDPDLQRTPVRSPEGQQIRRAFVAPPGSVLLSADWSQIELRVLAHFSEDSLLIDAFRRDADVHAETAARLFGVPLDQVSGAQRRIGKTINFATIYGQGATSLAQILGVPRKEAQGHIDTFFATYSGIRRWTERTVAEASERGYVTTLLGRRRWIPELSSQSPMDRQAGARIAVNTPIQGSAADLCKLAMLKLHRELVGTGARLLLQIHDELVLEVPAGEVESVRPRVEAAMSAPGVLLRVPLRVQVGIGASWGEAH